MCKRYTKLSKLLTNIHAGFVTALLGCVLTFAPLNAMAKPYFSAGDSGNCAVYSGVGVPSNAQFWGGQLITENKGSDPFYFTKGSTVYWIDDLTTCTSSQTANVEQVDVSNICGLGVTITRVASCTSNNTGTGGDDSGGGSLPTGGAIKCNSSLDCSASGSAGTGYTYIRTGKCPNAPGTCTDITYSYSCALGYGGTASCIRKNIGSVLSPTYIFECSGCYQSCSTDSDCPTNSTKKTNGGTYEVHRYKCISNLCKYGYVINDTDCTCKKGYYGTPVKNASYTGCTNLCQQCPTDTKSGVTGTTLGESRGKTSSYCYIPSNTPFTTTAGSGTYSGNCSY